jgi:hypothetical protein
VKRTGTSSFLLLLAAFALAAPAGRGQGIIELPDGTVIVVGEAGEGAEGGDEPTPAASSGGGADTAGVGTDAQRLQKLLAAPFDRRPRAILSTWGGVGIDLPAPPEADDGPKSEKNSAEKTRDPFADEVASLQSSVTTGDWAAVGSYLAALPSGHGAKVHRHICEVLWKAADPRADDPDAPLPQLKDRPIIRTADVLGLSAAAAPPIEEKTLDLLAALVRCAVAQGDAVDPLVSTWERGDGRLGGAEVSSRVAAAWVLVAAERPREAERFVPTLEATRTDPEGLDLLARFQLGRHAETKRPEPLAAAWQATVALLALPTPPPALRQSALERALLLAPKVGAELGSAYISASFSGSDGASARGRALLAVAGAHLAKLGAKSAREPDERLEALEAARGPIDALLSQAPDDPAWSPVLDLLLRTWNREAEVSLALGGGGSNERMPQFDDFGNLFFAGRQQHQDPRLPLPIPARDLLRLAPSEAWLRRSDEGPRRAALAAMAGLHLRQDHPTEAWALIERLAAVDRTTARDLGHELLRSWTKAHDLNAERRRNPYIYFYGFEQRADAIPLTRQKQERNLEELAGWVEKLRQLLPAKSKTEGLDEELVAEAFVKTHGQAEVYKLEAIARVFGDPSRCQPETLARIAQTMRGNLATLWRSPKVQEDQKTKRRDAEIQAEVRRGYEVACKVAADALVAHPARWELLLADASLRFDRNEHEHRETQSSASFAPTRADALKGFAAAAAAYARVVPGLAETEETLAPFELWFHASLGACDLPLVTREDRPDLPEAARVKAALEALPEPARTRHIERFARSLFQTLGGVKPEVKFGYLRAAFTIVGDHPGAREAKDVFDFYADLVREVQLVTRLDGSGRVGHGRPFGVHVLLRHTKEIERESGGFGKFLTNQNQASFSYNYGRPLEDYRDKFQEGATKALSERFEVVSITFHAPEVTARGDPEPGWRQTPYCYLTLKPRGPEVDQVPPLELSMDFLDTSGYVILPIASAPIPIDARDPVGDARPLAGLTVELTLDERRAKDGILGLEVEARGRGLVPPLDSLVDLSGLPAGGFEVAKTDDPGPSAVELLDDEQGVALGCERRFVLELRGLTGQTALPTSFRFPPVRVADAKVTRSRFVDADVVAVDEVVALDATYGARARWPWLLGAAALALLLGTAWLRARRPAAAVAAPRFQLPARATPFAVLELLGRLRASGAVAPADRAALDEAIAALERAHFAPGSAGASPDLAAVAGHWVGKISDR